MSLCTALAILAKHRVPGATEALWALRPSPRPKKRMRWYGVNEFIYD